MMIQCMFAHHITSLQHHICTNISLLLPQVEVGDAECMPITDVVTKLHELFHALAVQYRPSIASKFDNFAAGRLINSLC